MLARASAILCIALDMHGIHILCLIFVKMLLPIWFLSQHIISSSMCVALSLYDRAQRSQGTDFSSHIFFFCYGLKTSFADFEWYYMRKVYLDGLTKTKRKLGVKTLSINANLNKQYCFFCVCACGCVWICYHLSHRDLMPKFFPQ